MLRKIHLCYFSLAALLIFGLSFYFLQSQSEKLTAKNNFKIFNNCYTLLSGKSLSADSPYLLRLKENKIQAPELCQELISDLHLDAQGKVSSEKVAPSLAKNILARLQLVHQSWFNRMNILNDENEFTTSTLIDVQTPANFLSWTLFSDTQKIGDVFLTHQNPQAVRYSAVEQNLILEKELTVNYFHRRDAKPWILQLHDLKQDGSNWGIDTVKETPWQPDFVPMGELLGFRLAKDPRTISSDEAADLRNYKLPQQSLGGGVLGNPAYFAMNTGLNYDVSADGGLIMHRRWSENIFKDFFCRDLPVLSEMDVIHQVNLKSDFSFHKSPVCMKCHHTMDNLAAGARDLHVSWTGFIRKTQFVAKLVRKNESEEIPGEAHKDLLRTTADPLYSRTRPQGQLNYRNVDGQLISYPFSNLDELGKHIAGSKDFHYCMSKRYVKYFTGYDFDVLTTNSHSPQVQEFIHLANEFYKNKNQKQLIKNIFASSLFTHEVQR